jgi:chloramphenicol-sensitive protein RarD
MASIIAVAADTTNGKMLAARSSLWQDACPVSRTTTPLPDHHARPALAGVAYGLIAYGIWGFFPLYFHQLAGVPPADVLSHRAFWGWIFLCVLLTARHEWPRIQAVARQPGQWLRLAIAGLLVGSNWLVFLWAVANHEVMASSLGYFITPLVNVLLGLLVLGERLSTKAWLAVLLAAAAMVNEVLALGNLPWISLTLAATFGCYGLVRKQVPVGATTGLWFETLAMLPLCLVYVAWQGQAGHDVMWGHDAGAMTLLVLAGVLTALPLMAFGAATQRLTLATVGMLMYINPTLQFATAVWLFGEPLPPARIATFALIWIGLLLYAWSAWEKQRAVNRAPQAAPR